MVDPLPFPSVRTNGNTNIDNELWYYQAANGWRCNTTLAFVGGDSCVSSTHFPQSFLAAPSLPRTAVGRAGGGSARTSCAIAFNNACFQSTFSFLNDVETKARFRNYLTLSLASLPKLPHSTLSRSLPLSLSPPPPPPPSLSLEARPPSRNNLPISVLCVPERDLGNDCDEDYDILWLTDGSLQRWQRWASFSQLYMFQLEEYERVYIACIALLLYPIYG